MNCKISLVVLLIEFETCYIFSCEPEPHCLPAQPQPTHQELWASLNLNCQLMTHEGVCRWRCVLTDMLSQASPILATSFHVVQRRCFPNESPPVPRHSKGKDSCCLSAYHQQTPSKGYYLCHNLEWLDFGWGNSNQTYHLRCTIRILDCFTAVAVVYLLCHVHDPMKSNKTSTGLMLQLY